MTTTQATIAHLTRTYVEHARLAAQGVDVQAHKAAMARTRRAIDHVRYPVQSTGTVPTYSAPSTVSLKGWMY